MFCPKCGHQLPEESDFCSNCGSETGEGITQESKITPDILISDIAQKSVDSKNKNLSTVIKIIALLLGVLFFFPMFSVSCSGVTFSFSGFESTFGKTISAMGSSERVDGDFRTIMLLLIPIALFLIFQIKNKGKAFTASIILSVAGLIALNIFSASVQKMAEREYLVAEFLDAYYFSMVLYVVSAVISGWGLFTQRKKE